jgi:hypothetical protein
MSDCPGADLILLALHDLIEDPSEAERFDQHVSSCESCSAEQSALQGALESPELLEPPPEVLESLHKQIAEEAAKTPRPLPADVRIRLLCTYCKDDLLREGEPSSDPGAQTVYCATCLAPCHQECFDDHGSCAAPGCEGRSLVHVQPPAPAAEPARPLRSAAILLLSAVLGGGIVAALAYPERRVAGSTQPSATKSAQPSVSDSPAPVEGRAWAPRRARTYVGGAVVVEVDFGGDPTSPIQPRTLPSRELNDPTLLHLDGVARVEWIQPAPAERAQFLVQGLGEGLSVCEVEFADGSRLMIQTEVSGDDPHVVARRERQELDRETHSRRLLAQERADAFEAGERLLSESKLPGREGNLRKAYLRFARASDAAEALGAAEGRRGGRTQATADWIKRTRFAELRANVDWEEASHLALQKLRALWTAAASEDLHQRQGEELARALRLLQHSCDPRYRRLEVTLRQSFPELAGQLGHELCPRDERSQPSRPTPLPPGLALIQQGIVISLVKEQDQVTVRMGSKVLSRPEDWTGGEAKDAPVWARLEAELLLIRERAGARASLVLEASSDLPAAYAVLALEAISRAGIAEVSLASSPGEELSARERSDLTSYRIAVDIIRDGQVSRYTLARERLKSIDPKNPIFRHAEAYLDWLDADAEVRQAQAFYAAGDHRRAFQLLSDAYNHPSLDDEAKASVRKLQTRWSRVVRSFERAKGHQDANRYKAAIREYREVMAQEPDPDHPLHDRARKQVEDILSVLRTTYRRKRDHLREAFRKEDWRTFHTWASELSRDRQASSEDLEWIRESVTEANTRLRLYERCARAFRGSNQDKYVWADGVLQVLASWLPETDAAGNPNRARADARTLWSQIKAQIRRWQSPAPSPQSSPPPQASPSPSPASPSPATSPAPLEPGAVVAAPPFTASFKDTLEGAVLQLEGLAKDCPDGTKLHVRLLLAARAPQRTPAEVSFFVTAVAGEKFAARKVFARRKVTPGRYTLEVELVLADQRQALAEFFRRARGLERDARVTLGKLAFQSGTPEEVAALDERWVAELRKRLTAQRALQKRLLALEGEVRQSRTATSTEALRRLLKPVVGRPPLLEEFLAAPGANGPYETLVEARAAQARAARVLRDLEPDRASASLQEAEALLDRAEKALP